MGLSLFLFPIDDLYRGTSGFSHTILNIGDVSWDLGAEIQKVARRLPDGHDISAFLAGTIRNGANKGERCYGTLAKDRYGEPYRWLTAEELLPFLKKHWSKHPATGYVRAMPSDGLIVLDWH